MSNDSHPSTRFRPSKECSVSRVRLRAPGRFHPASVGRWPGHHCQQPARGSHVCPRAGRSHCHSPCTPADHAAPSDAGATSDLPRDQKIPVAVTTPRRGARPPRVAAASACSAFERRKKNRLQRANNLSFPAISDLNYRLHESMDALLIWWARHRIQVLSCAKHDIPLCRRSLGDAFSALSL